MKQDRNRPQKRVTQKPVTPDYIQFLPLCAEKAKISSHLWRAWEELLFYFLMSHHLDARCLDLGLIATEAVHIILEEIRQLI